MADTALSTAFNGAAPQDERSQAMTEAQAAAMPSRVDDMLPLVKYVAEQYQEQEFSKSLQRARIIPFPSRAVEEKQPGMQSLRIDDTYGNSMGE